MTRGGAWLGSLMDSVFQARFMIGTNEIVMHFLICRSLRVLKSNCSHRWRVAQPEEHENAAGFGRPSGTLVSWIALPRVPLRSTRGYFRSFPPGTLQ